MRPAVEILGLKHFARAYAYWRQHGVGEQLLQGKWYTCAAACMQWAGFQSAGHGTWQEPQGSRCRWEHAHVKHDLERVAHLLREAERQCHFSAFLRHPRRDQAEAARAGAANSESICKIARSLYQAASKEQRGLLLGAAFSMAAYGKVRDDQLVPQHLSILRRCLGVLSFQ